MSKLSAVELVYLRAILLKGQVHLLATRTTTSETIRMTEIKNIGVIVFIIIE
jgi:hypothetical protein